MHTGDGELFDRNVDTVTDNAEYKTRSVSAREVGWQTCPGVFIGVSLRTRIQVMANLIGRQHEVQVSAGLERKNINHYIACLRAHSVMGSDYDNGEDGDSHQNYGKKKYTDHVKKKKSR